MQVTDQVAGQIEAAIEAFPGREGLCGVVRISRAGAPLFERAYGHASLQLGVPNGPQTRFHIASVTKMFISAAVVRLACGGTLSLDAHPSRYLPEAAPLDPRITLHQLLSHTSGLADIYARPDLRQDMQALAARRGRLLDYLIALPRLAEPGARWSYSTTGYLLLACILERAGGAPFGAVMEATLLRPLGLADTGEDDPRRVNPGRALGHVRRRDGSWRNAPNDALAEADGPRELYSTAADLDRWGCAIMAGEVLSPDGAALTFAPHAHVGPGSDFDPSLDYGYGWFLGPGYRWIGGMTAGFRAAMWQYPAERLNVVMLWNNERVDSQGLFRALAPILLG
ncbi:MAG TPA: serine hydrolase domain-containing protein [Caulobacteraceae bacterium]|jgi:CubicO group peptidase (beta-lactamase class C family)